LLLDVRLILERRLALGLSRPALAKRVSRSSSVIERLERGDNHDRLTLDLVVALARALAVQPGDLFPAAAPRPTQPDDTRVEAALAMVDKGLAASELAQGLGWAYDRVLAALGALGERLRPTGINLHQHAGRWRLRSRVAVLGRDEQRGIEQARVANARLSLYDAQVLAQVVVGDVTARWVADASNAQRVSLATLMRLGYAEPSGAGLKPTQAVRYSLGVEEPTPASKGGTTLGSKV